jgi:protein SCO1/2
LQFKSKDVSKKAILALCVAVLLPVVSYLLVKKVSDHAVVMPRHYFPDSVSEKIVDGKYETDTVWHRVRNISLTNQLGKKVSLDDLHDKVLVVDFFFTHCPSICPYMTRNMRRLQDMMVSRDPRRVIDTPLVHFVSISIDPERDTPDALKQYADRYGVDHEMWWMLTGNKDSIYNFGIQEMKMGMIDGNGVDTLFEHSPKFVLLDKNREVRGFYNGTDTADVLKLSQDIVFLSLEKDKSQPSEVAAQLKSIWPVYLIAVIALVFFWWIFRKKPDVPV